MTTMLLLGINLASNSHLLPESVLEREDLLLKLLLLLLLLTLKVSSLDQEILCNHQAALCGSLRPLHLQCGSPGSAKQDPERPEPDEGGAENPSQRPREAQLVLRPGEDCLQQDERHSRTESLQTLESWPV